MQGFGELGEKLLCLELCHKIPGKVKKLQFSIGFSIPGNSIENGTVVSGGYKKHKESERVSGNRGLCRSLNRQEC